ncbi:MAG: protoporphyrinogen oxidase [Acidobacteria bacterium]|nr:MAG: protoporphyrinogen oxidase [Acidobacteriota bacterium]
MPLRGREGPEGSPDGISQSKPAPHPRLGRSCYCENQSVEGIGSSLTVPNTARRRVVVVGGGISGLAAAYRLARAREAGAPVEEFLIEASGRLGGVIRTEKFGGFVIEGGPDSFLTEKPEAAALCRELGLGGELLGSNDRDRRTYILHRGRLVPLPDGLFLLVPTRLWPMVWTRVLPLGSKVAALREFFRRPHPSDGSADESVAAFVSRHFGQAMVENIVDPLLAGVYGGDSEALSAPAVLARFWAMEKQTGSLTRAVLAAHRARPRDKPAPPLFTTPEGGLEGMVRALAARLASERFLLNRKVLALERRPARAGERPWTVRMNEGAALEADGVVLALPAYETAELVAGFDAKLASLLSGIPYSSAVTVALGYDTNEVRLPPGFGFLVPHREGRRLLAATFVHAKFPRRAPPGRALIRAFLGGTRDAEIADASENEIVAMVLGELGEILGLRSKPLFQRVYRSPRAMAQSNVGHLERLRGIEERLAEHQGLTLAGNAYSGIGISDCIRTGEAAAKRAVAQAAEGRPVPEPVAGSSAS